MVRHFQPQTLVKQSGIEHTPDAQLVSMHPSAVRPPSAAP